MAFLATSARRQLVMATLLAAGVFGAVIRHQAPNPSTLRDIGTLLMVLWLPAVGNLIAFLLRKIPRRAPPAPPPTFVAGTPFEAHLRVALERLPGSDAVLASLDPSEDRATLVASRQGFIVRLREPVAQWLAQPGVQPVDVQSLSPDMARRLLRPGTGVHLLVGPTAVAKGKVVG